MELQRRSSGVAKGGLTTGIIGTALGGLNSLALMGAGVNAATRNNGNETVDVVTPVNPWGWNGNWGMWGNSWGNPWFGQTPQTVVINTNEDSQRNSRGGDFRDGNCCSEDRLVNRYELELQQKLAEKDSQIALRDANTYNDQKMLEMYKYIDGQLKDIRAVAADQAVTNQKTADSFQIVSERMDCLRKDMDVAIRNEARERKCADNSLVTYMNATFYPKQIADVTVGATSVPQATYNPLPCCDDCCH